MLEITYTEIALFLWAIVATAKWLHYKDSFRKAAVVLKSVVEDAETRNALISSYENFKKSLVKN